MKQLLVLSILLLFSSTLKAQSLKLSGVVQGEAQEPIPFATIGLLKQQDSSLIQGTISDENGNFLLKDIPEGTYLIKAQHLQYVAKFIIIKLEKHEKIAIILEEVSTDLAGVEIVAEKEKFMNTADVHSIQVAQSLISSGGTAIDVLKSSPLITVGTEGTVSLRGRTDIQILVNGRPSGFASLQGARFLEQLDAASIERIEIITNPSAKDGPNGGGGVINIVLKKQAATGFHGNIQAYGGNGRRFGFAPNINYRLQNFNLFLNYNLRRRTRKTNSDSFREQLVNNQTVSINQKSNSERDDWRQRLEFGADFFFSENTFVTLAGQYRSRHKESDQFLISNSFENGLQTENRASTIAEPEDNEGLAVNVNLSSKQGEHNELNAFFEYLYSEEDETIQRLDQITEHQFEGGKTKYVDVNKRIIGDFALTRPLGKQGTYDVGIRWIYRLIEQDFSYRLTNETTGELENDFFQQDQFFYQDHRVSAYAQTKKQIKRFKLELGLRIEKLLNDYNTTNNPTNFSRDFLNFFPSAKFGYASETNHQIQFSYARKYNLPSPNRLNPFIDISQPFRIAQGNPNLNPEFIQLFELSYTKDFEKLSFNGNLFYRRYTNLIQRISTLDSDGIQTVVPINLDMLHNYGFDFSFSWEATDFWDIQGGFLIYENQFTSSEIADNNGNNYQVKLIHELTLPKSFKLELLSTYQSPEIIAQGESRYQFSMDLGIRKKFSDSFTGTLTISDLLNTLKEGDTLTTENLQIKNTTKIDTRRLRLSLKYKF